MFDWWVACVAGAVRLINTWQRKFKLLRAQIVTKNQLAYLPIIIGPLMCEGDEALVCLPVYRLRSRGRTRLKQFSVVGVDVDPIWLELGTFMVQLLNDFGKIAEDILLFW